MLRAALRTSVTASAAAYGYTVSIWCSGALLLRSHGLPTVAEVFAFAAGALAGFGLMRVISHWGSAPTDRTDAPHDRALAGALHWLSVGAAVGAVALLAHLGGWEVWPLASFAATCLYLLCAGVQLMLVWYLRPAR